MIYLILKILALFDLTVPGYSRDGPPCAIAKFAGVRYKPAWSTANTARCAEVWTLFAVGQ